MKKLKEISKHWEISQINMKEIKGGKSAQAVPQPPKPVSDFCKANPNTHICQWTDGTYDPQ